MVTEDQWQKLLRQFDEVKRSLLHKGSLGIMKYVDMVTPLCDRLEQGERSEELFFEIAVIVNQQELDERTRSQAA